MRRALYVVVRSDLPWGLQFAQACHAAHEFGRGQPEAEVGDTLIVLHAPDERTLWNLMRDAQCECWPVLGFHEPDMGGSLTAVAFGGAAAKLLKRLPLAGASPLGAAGADCRSQ